MQKEKPSIFERLLGTVRLEENEHDLPSQINGKKDFSSLKVRSTDEEKVFANKAIFDMKKIVIENLKLPKDIK
jgi:hypothetical protein